MMTIEKLQLISVAALALATTVIVVRLAYVAWQSGRVAKRGRILVHVPHVWTLRALHESTSTLHRPSTAQVGYYVAARPWCNLGGFRHRLRCAVLAFTGQCDLLRWPEGQ